MSTEYKAGSRLEKILSEGRFAVTGECGPPKSADGGVIEGKAKLLDFAGFRAQTLGLVNDLTMAKLQSYDKYWREAEAYSLVQSL